MILCDPPLEDKKDSENLPGIPSEWNEALAGLWSTITDAGQLRAHEVEEAIWLQVLALGRKVLGTFFDQSGDGDVGETLEGPGGRMLRRLPKLRSRAYRSISLVGSDPLSLV